MKEWSIIIVSSECDDKNYKTHKSATQQTINSSDKRLVHNSKFELRQFETNKEKLNLSSPPTGGGQGAYG